MSLRLVSNTRRHRGLVVQNSRPREVVDKLRAPRFCPNGTVVVVVVQTSSNVGFDGICASTGTDTGTGTGTGTGIGIDIGIGGSLRNADRSRGAKLGKIFRGKPNFRVVQPFCPEFLGRGAAVVVLLQPPVQARRTVKSARKCSKYTMRRSKGLGLHTKTDRAWWLHVAMTKPIVRWLLSVSTTATHYNLAFGIVASPTPHRQLAFVGIDIYLALTFRSGMHA